MTYFFDCSEEVPSSHNKKNVNIKQFGQIKTFHSVCLESEVFIVEFTIFLLHLNLISFPGASVSNVTEVMI